MSSNSVFWQLGAMAVQEALAGSLLVFAVYGVVVLLLRSLDAASRRTRPVPRLGEMAANAPVDAARLDRTDRVTAFRPPGPRPEAANRS